jgi:hypothetical protein
MLTSLPSSTGEKIHYCPDTSQVLGTSESLNREERCNYSTHDPSLLTRHRKKTHGHIPHTRAPSKNTGTFEIVFENISSYYAATSSTTTSRARKPKRVRKPKAAAQRAKSTRTRAAGKVKDPDHAEDTASDSSLPSTSQQGAGGYNVELSDTIVPSPAGLTACATPNGDVASEAYAQVRAERPYRTSSNNNTFVASNSLTDAQSLHATAYNSGSYSNTTQVAPYQGDLLFDPASIYDWSRFYEGSTSLFTRTTGMYNPATYYPSLNPEINTYATGNLGLYFGQDNLSGFEAWDESGYNIREKYNSYAR